MACQRKAVPSVDDSNLETNGAQPRKTGPDQHRPQRRRSSLSPGPQPQSWRPGHPRSPSLWKVRFHMVLSGCRRAGAGRHRLGLCVKILQNHVDSSPPAALSLPLLLSLFSVSLTHTHPPTQLASQPPTHTRPTHTHNTNGAQPWGPGCPGVDLIFRDPSSIPGQRTRSHIPHNDQKKKKTLYNGEVFPLPNPVPQSFVYTGITHWTSSF